MAWLRWFLLGLLVGLGLLGIWWRTNHGTELLVFDFVQQFDVASVRRPNAEVFVVRDVTISSVSKPSITVRQPSRIAWDFTVPDNARVEADIALEHEAWTRSGDGVLFRIGLSYEGQYEEMVTQLVNPFAVESDRRWVPIAVDLSAYAGRAVSLIFNTGPGLEGDNRENDLGVWGAPRLVTR